VENIGNKSGELEFKIEKAENLNKITEI